MGTSSARPSDLRQFAARGRRADNQLEAHARRLRIAYGHFLDGTEWGAIELTSLLGGFAEYIDWNEIDAMWVARIARAFEAAGGDGAIKTLPDSAIHASLKAAGLLGGRGSVSFDDPIAYGMPPTTGYTNDPVNTASGNFVELEHDLSFGGLATLLSFARTYNSRSDRSGAFGPGWSSWAGARLRPRAEGAEYEGPDGQRALFPRQGEGYGRVIGVRGLVEPGRSGLVLRWFGGGTWEFDEAGLPVRIENGPGTVVTLEHDGGRLVALRHGSGKRIDIEWDGEGERISALGCSDGRRVDYSYDAAEHLVEADGPGGLRAYEAAPENGRVLSVSDADGIVEVANAYDEQGRVMRQLSPFGRHTLIGYLPGRVTVTSDENDGPTNIYIHDDDGRLLSVVDGDDRRVSIQYDQYGNQVAFTDRKGAVTVQEWDERGNLLRRLLPTGAGFTFTYDEADRVLEVNASTGAVVAHAYDGDERSPVEVIDAEGGVTKLTVAGGLVREIVDPDGVRLRFAFDDDGNIVATTDADGNVARLERDGAGRVTAAVTPLGRRTTFTYDVHGRPLERHDAGGAAWRCEYSAAGRITALVDPTGAREEIRYAEHGAAQAFVDPIGRVTAHSYDVFGNRVAVLAPDGASWSFGYDALCRLTSINDPSGATWLREYDVNGNLTGSVDPVGIRRSATFDDADRLTALDDGLTSATFDFDPLSRCLAQLRPDGAAAQADYDLMGRRTSIEDPLGGRSTIEYTPAGRVARVVQPSGSSETFEYDHCGRAVARTDGAGRRWEFRYDGDHALVETITPSGESERLSYDAAGRIEQWSAPGRGPTSYSYDAAARVTAITDRSFGTRRFEYDRAGQLVAATDANGAVTRYDYDERGRLTKTTDPLGGTLTRAYDSGGRLASMTDQLGRTTTSSYDAAGRLVERADAAGRRRRWSYDVSGRVRTFGGADEEPVTVDRDDLGRETHVREPGSFTHAFSWDRAGRLVKRNRDALRLRWGYDEDGRRAFIGYPDGTQTDYAYDGGGLVASLRHPGTGAIELERDAGGRLIAARGAGMRASWEYDRGELVGYAFDAGDVRRSARLTRDPIGRIVAAVADDHEQGFAYDAAGQLIRAGNLAFDYDSGGRLVRERGPAGTVGYEHDAAGQLLVRRSEDGAATSYEYDGSGRRVRASGDDLDRRYRWDSVGRLVAIEDGDRVTSASVDALGELADIDGTALLWDTTRFSPPAWIGDRAVIGHGAPWAIAAGGDADWLAPDWQGTVGGPRDPYGAPLGPAEPTPQLGYRGELEFAGETWLRARAYEPGTRSFLQPDPLPPIPGTACAGNPYHYAANNPIGLADPSGRRPVTDTELRELRDAMGQNFVHRNADQIVAGALVVGGIAVMATGVGGPIGAAMIGGALLSAGSSAAIQKVTTGSVDYRDVAIAGIAGAAGGGVGAWATGARALATASPLVRGAVIGGASSATEGAVDRGLHGDNPFDPAGMGRDLLLGGGTGAVSGHLGDRLDPRSNIVDDAAIDYGTFDDLGRPTGVSARLTPEMAGTGTDPARSIRPPGFGGGEAGHARAHLLANQLGGSGTEPRNLVTLHQNPANSPAMRGFESETRRALDAGQTVDYTSTPIYRGDEPMPIGVTISAQGSGGLDISVSVLNRGR
jgi:RHS repeat-associated protein